ncbi:MAG TPA: hypothetical protein VGI74_22355 [Streptosporangiaceae bacterium]
MFSALGGKLPAPGQRLAFAEEVRRALAPHDRFHEHVHVAVLAGVRRAVCRPWRAGPAQHTVTSGDR